jgi:putative glycosyltransferase (TIGR04372 family)
LEFQNFTIEDYERLCVFSGIKLLNFNTEEKANFIVYLGEKSLNRDSEFVGLCLRDDKYDALHSDEIKRAQQHRNVNSHLQLEIVKTLVNRKVPVVRLGRVGHRIIDNCTELYLDLTQETKKVPDYLDFSLASRCKFVISSGTGVDAAAVAARKRLYTFNIFPIGTFYKGDNFPFYLSQDYVCKFSGEKLDYTEIYSQNIENTTLFELESIGIGIKPKSNSNSRLGEDLYGTFS